MSRVPIRMASRSKYREVRTEGPNGKFYASKKEANRAQELHLLWLGGHIQGLHEQCVYELLPKDELGPALRYVADFVYYKTDGGCLIVEDVKGFKTPAYRLKRRLMWHFHKIRVQEV